MGHSKEVSGETPVWFSGGKIGTMSRNEEMEALVNKPPGDDSGRNKSAKSASPTSKALIARNLKAVYGQVASEPVPDFLLNILKPLDGEDKKS